jgi:hypothetical protein
MTSSPFGSRRSGEVHGIGSTRAEVTLAHVTQKQNGASPSGNRTCRGPGRVTTVDLCGSEFGGVNWLSRVELGHHRVGALPEMLIATDNRSLVSSPSPRRSEVPFGPPSTNLVWSRCSSDDGKGKAFHRK